MTKKAAIIPIILAMIFLLSSCAKNRNENVYFIHAVCFEEQSNGDVGIYAVSEKQVGDKAEGEKGSRNYEVISAEGKNHETATKAFSDKYKNVYFATSEIYIFKDDSTADFIKTISRSLCDSSVYPVKSSVIITNVDNTEDFLGRIKNVDDVKRLLSLSKKNRVNIVSFFAKINEGKDCYVPIIGTDDSGELIFIEKRKFGEGERYE